MFNLAPERLAYLLAGENILTTLPAYAEIKLHRHTRIYKDGTVILFFKNEKWTMETTIEELAIQDGLTPSWNSYGKYLQKFYGHKIVDKTPIP